MKKLLSAAAAAAIFLSAFSGCGNNNAASKSVIPAGEDFSYPVETSEKLSYWYVDTTSGKIKRETTPLYQEFAKRTGVEIEYIPVASSVAKEQFNLLLASGSLPDIISYDWAGIPGGAQSAVDSGQILKLNDLLDNHMPNLKAYLKSDAERDKQAKNDDGNYCVVPSFRGQSELLVYTGPIVRKDWLDELGLEVPETLDDWYEVLTAFKEKKGASAPLSCLSDYLWLFVSGAYPVTMGGYTDDFYVDNGKVIYTPAQPAAKEALKVLNKWYEEGLIDPNIASLDTNTIDAKMTNGQAGASIFLTGGGLGKWMSNKVKDEPSYNLVGAKYPVVNKGDRAILGTRDNWKMSNAQAISTNAKNPELAARYLDYFFTEDGINLLNYGIEGESYDIVDGKRVFKKELLENGELMQYCDVYGGYGVQQWDAYSQTLIFENQKDAIKNWEDNDAAEHLIPPVSFTEEESAEATKLLNDIKTYKNEMFVKFLIGVEDIETGFDAYVSQLKAMGIDKATEYKQAALDRYNKR